MHEVFRSKFITVNGAYSLTSMNGIAALEPNPKLVYSEASPMIVILSPRKM